jgi:hypothetical protein
VDSRLQEDPDGKIRLWEWTSLFSGKSPQGEAAEINGIENMCNKICVDLTFIESPAPAKQLFSARKSPLQGLGHRDIRYLFPKAMKQTPAQVSLDYVVESKIELQEQEAAQKQVRLQFLKDKYASAACIKLSSQARNKNVTWLLQQNEASKAGRFAEQLIGQEVTAKDAGFDGIKELLEDVEMEDTDLTSPISDVEQAPPKVQRGSKHRIATKAAKLAKQLKEQEKIAADTAAFALALKERERMCNDQSLQDESQEESCPATSVPGLSTPASTSSTQGGSVSRSNFFSDLAAVRRDVHVRYVGQTVLNTPNYPSVPHGFLPENEICDREKGN